MQGIDLQQNSKQFFSLQTSVFLLHPIAFPDKFTKLKCMQPPPAGVFQMRITKVVSCIAIAVIVYFVFVRFAGLGNFVAYTRGEDSVIDLIQDPRATGPAINVRNLTFSKITVLGYTTSCSCVGISGLPIDIQPGTSTLLPIEGGVDKGVEVRITLLIQDTAGIREKQVKVSNFHFSHQS